MESLIENQGRAYGQAQEIQDNSSRASLEKIAEPTQTVSYDRLDILDLIRQGRSPQEAAEMASKSLYNELGLDYKVEIEKQAKKASLEDEVSNLEVLTKTGKNIITLLYFAPSHFRDSDEEHNMSLPAFATSIIANSFLGTCLSSTLYDGEKVISMGGMIGCIPIVTNIASGIYEYLRHTKNKMREEKKSKRLNNRDEKINIG